MTPEHSFLPYHSRSSPPFEPPQCGQFALLPTHSPHCQLQPCACMQNKYMCLNCQAAWKMWGGDVAFMPLTILVPFCTILAGNSTFPNLLQSCRFPGLKQHLHDNSMLQIWIWGRGLGSYVGDPIATGCGCKHRKCDTSASHACFQASPSLGVATKHTLSGNWKWSRSRVRVVSGGPKCCVTSASLECTAQQ